MTWGSRYGQEYPEVAEMGYLCMDIRGLFEQKYPTWAANNFFGPDTYASNVYQCSDSVKSSGSYDYLATFHVGHMFPYMYPYGHYEWPPGAPGPIWVIDGYVRHYAYYGDSGEYTGVIDFAMYPHGGAKHYFTMIWTCTNGDLFINPLTGQLCYGYYDSAHGTGWVGMPYAWTQTTGLDKTGYDPPIESSNFCYIGFENMSKLLTASFEGHPTNNYGDFIRRFYYHALINQRSIKEALDYATADMGVGMSKFNAPGNDLYWGWDEYAQGQWWKCRMRVYGDGNNILGVIG
ncbi:MAG: hypothetical protein QW744_05660 [Candidatus Bathyarchaeia archaeon]